MDDKSKKKRNLFILITYILTVTSFTGIFLLPRIIGGDMDEHIQHTVSNSAKMCAEMVERQYTSDMLLMEGLAMRMSTTLEEDVQEAMERLVSTAERYGMKRISFSAPDGSTFSTDGAKMNLKGIANFEKALKGEAHLTTTIHDEAGGEDINVYSFPVYREGTEEIMGVMSAVYYSELFRDLVTVDTYNGEGYTYIIDRSGNVVINSNHHNAIPNLENVFDYMEAQHINMKTVSKVKSSLDDSVGGFFDIYGIDSDKLACYVPLNINDWYVVSIVPKSVAEEEKNAVMFSLLIYCICVALVAVFVVISIRSTQREKNRILKRALYEDPVTGGATYEKFRIDCREKLQMNSERKAVCVFLDIDNFDLVATLYGREESDETIRRVYSIIQMSAGENAIIGRDSAAQFYIMYFYNEDKELEESIKLFQKILREKAKYETMLRPVLGIYIIEDCDESIDDMANKARIAHETITQNSNSNVGYYDVHSRNTLHENRHFEEEMARALENREFVPFIQPKYTAESAEVCGGEALIRWITPDGKIVSPGKFIPLAENNGFIRELDRAMFEMVCLIQKHLVDKGMTPIPISVNVSRQLMYDKNFADDYCNKIKEIGISPELVELEITESALFEDLDLFRATLEKLRGYGFRILMDDFGTGYSSLMMLKSVPIDEIKLDKSFIDDYDNEKGSSIIRCVLELAQMLNMPVVAEGVETQSQYEYLKQMGCDIIQGFYFAKPMPVEEFVKKMV